MKTIYDRISERLKGYADSIAQYEIGGQSLRPGRFDRDVEYDEYRRARELKSALLKEYRGKAVEAVFPGREITTPSGTCYCIENEGRARFEKPCAEAAREKVLSDLKLLHGIGPVKEKQLKKQGISSIPDLIDHNRFGSEASRLLEAVERCDSCGIQEHILRWYPRSHPLSFFVSGFHSVSDFILLDIETLGLFTRPIILIGLARIESGRILFEQFLLRGIEEEAAALEAVVSRIGSTSAFVTFNGRGFDIPYIRERLFYYGLGGDLERAHFDLLPYSRRAWGEDSPNCRLVTLEKFLFSRERTDDVPSALVPEFYETYQRTGNPGPLVPIVEHNRKDLETLALLFCKLNEAWSR